MIRLSHVEIPEAAIRRVEKLLRSGTVGQSDVIAEFEEAFAKWSGAFFAVAVSSGTMADTIALAVLKEFYPGKNEVIVPALTFIAQVNSITYNGLKPVFEDLQYRGTSHLNSNTLCFFPVHLLGKPAPGARNWLPRAFPMIEDSCEAMGSKVGGRKCGTLGDMGTFSFFPSHTMTTGEGGMIVTNSKRYADLAKRLRNHGKMDSETFRFDVIGFNGKMTSIQAAIGIECLKTIDKSIQKRRENFMKMGGMELEGEFISPHAFPVFCASRELRDKLMQRLKEEGVECRNLFSSIPTQEYAYAHLGYRLGEFPNSEKVGDTALYVPCHQGLTDKDINKIKEIINEEKAETSEVLVNVN